MTLQALTSSTPPGSPWPPSPDQPPVIVAAAGPPPRTPAKVGSDSHHDTPGTRSSTCASHVALARPQCSVVRRKIHHQEDAGWGGAAPGRAVRWSYLSEQLVQLRLRDVTLEVAHVQRRGDSRSRSGGRSGGGGRRGRRRGGRSSSGHAGQAEEVGPGRRTGWVCLPRGLRRADGALRRSERSAW